SLDRIELAVYTVFYEAEDGIRDFHVTGVQTSALPIWRAWLYSAHVFLLSPHETVMTISLYAASVPVFKQMLNALSDVLNKAEAQIGRASCRERVSVGGVGEAVKDDKVHQSIGLLSEQE